MQQTAPPPESAEEIKKETARRKKEFERKGNEALYGKLQLIGLLTFSLCLPAGVLFFQANDKRAVCNEDTAECTSRCTEMYASVNRVFSSDYLPEKECMAKCEEKATVCLDGVNALLIAAALLLGGLGVSLCLIYLLQAIMGNSDEDAALLANKRPRAAYVEPVLTEEEQRKALSKKTKEYPPPKEDLTLLTEVKCLDCDIVCLVSMFWLPDNACSKGGMESSICSRCRKPVVGLL